MKNALALFLLPVMIMSCNGKTESAKPCSVQSAAGGASIVCPDGSSQFIASGDVADASPKTPEPEKVITVVEGIDGINGKNGTDGKDGDKGIDGSNGADGKDGSKGVDGTNGEKGEKGDSALSGLYVYDVNNAVIGEYKGGLLTEKVAAKLADGTLILLQNGYTQPVSSDFHCSYINETCEGTCYAANSNVIPSGSYVRFNHTGANGVDQGGKLITGSTSPVAIKSSFGPRYYDRYGVLQPHCQIQLAGSTLNSWITIEPYTPPVAIYQAPMDIRVRDDK